MKYFAVASFMTILVFVLDGCSNEHHPKSLSDVSEQLTEQFRRECDSRPHSLPEHRVKSVEITGFSTPSGNPHPYLGIGVSREGTDGINYTGVPLIQLGDGLFGITYQDFNTKEEFSAILSFR